jgi:polar amino acid transport system permease protein
MSSDVWDWNLAASVTPALLKATTYTVVTTGLAFLGAATLGLPIALARRNHAPAIRRPAAAIVEFIRSTPLLIQIYALYFLLPSLGFVLPALTSGIIALSVHYATYLSETYRAALDSVPLGQREACAALGLKPRQALLTVVLPQAIVAAIPALGNHLIALFKETPLLSAIAIVELLQTAKLIGAETFRYTEPISIVGFIFLALSLVSAALIRSFERRLSRWRS